MRVWRGWDPEAVIGEESVRDVVDLGAVESVRDVESVRGVDFGGVERVWDVEGVDFGGVERVRGVGGALLTLCSGVE